MTFKTHLKAFLVVVIVGSLMAFGVYKYMNRISAHGVDGLETLEQLRDKGVPAFVGKDIQGRTVTSDSNADKVVILNFWASWCGPCIEEVPSLLKLVEHYKGQVILVAVSGDSSMEDIEVFLKSFPGMRAENVYVVFDEDRSHMKNYGVRRLPESLVMGKGWTVERKLAGSINWYTPDALNYIDNLLKK